MNIPDSFFEAEIRDGFYVPSIGKQAWAAELTVLYEFDRICKKYNIPYFADWGTLLGTVRHNGFIPWDDDLDITMKRADYIRFLKIAKEELPEDFALFTYETHPDFWHFLARIVSKNRICFEEEHLRKYHGFPYITGIDIFVLDYVCTDPQKEELRRTQARYVIAVADQIAEGILTGADADVQLDRIESMFHIQLESRTDLHRLRVQLYRLTEKLFGMFSEDESEELTQLMPIGLYEGNHFHLSKKYYEKQIFLPFENTTMPVPSGYDEMLRKRYGNYMHIVRGSGGHEYPFFRTQKEQLQSVLDFELPGYKYRGIAPHHADAENQNSLKFIVQFAYQELVKRFREISRQTAADFAILQECQQLAIEMGTYIEKCKGEKHPAIPILEDLCEVIFQLSQNYTAALAQQASLLLTQLNQCIQNHILNHKEVVFLPYKASQWEYIQSVWQAAIDDPHYDVSVVPIPYFYKEYDGSLRDMQYEASQFPENVHICAYETFDFELHYPEKIVIQNPYDEFDPVSSIHPDFYSEKIKKYTQQLIYIPPFTLEEFATDSYREYYNMQYYCTVPGVINADKVIVQSENMKKLYVEKLTEFAGEDTREIWNEKILEIGSPKEDLPSQTDTLFSEYQEFIKTKDGKRKKIILYYTGISSFIQYGTHVIEKIHHVFQHFQSQKDTLLLWLPDKLIENTLEQTNPVLYQQYCTLRSDFCKSSMGILVQNPDNTVLAATCDAYYGDTSSLASLFRNMHKPVMIQDINILN